MTNTKRYICANCATVNQLDLARMDNIQANMPLCIECKQVVFSGQALTLNDDNFTKVISSSDIPIIVDFWSIACGPCKAMLPAYAKTSEELFPKVILSKLNIETASQITEKYNIRGLPYSKMDNQ